MQTLHFLLIKYFKDNSVYLQAVWCFIIELYQVPWYDMSPYPLVSFVYPHANDSVDEEEHGNQQDHIGQGLQKYLTSRKLYHK